MAARPRLRWIARVLLTLAAVYLGLCIAARLGYRVLLYPAPNDPPFVPPPGVELLSLQADDGRLVVAARYRPTNDRARTVVVFHGNGETLGGRAALGEALQSRGLGVVLTEFRGYGLAARSGPPNEQGLYRDASAVLDELARQGIGPSRVTLLGISLGTGVAAEMAARGRAASLVLVSPYTSITAMARNAFPLLPGGWLCPDRFDTLSKCPELHLPTLVIHGDEDQVVPFSMGEQVAASIPGAELRVVHGGHHNDLFLIDGTGLVEAIVEQATR